MPGTILLLSYTTHTQHTYTYICMHILFIHTTSLPAISHCTSLRILYFYSNRFAFSAVQSEFISDSTIHEDVLSFLYFICYSVCFVSALIVLSQSTVVVMFGPSKALKGDSSDSVKDASENMRQQQWLVLCIGGISISALFLT